MVFPKAAAACNLSGGCAGRAARNNAQRVAGFRLPCGLYPRAMRRRRRRIIPGIVAPQLGPVCVPFRERVFPIPRSRGLAIRAAPVRQRIVRIRDNMAVNRLAKRGLIQDIHARSRTVDHNHGEQAGVCVSSRRVTAAKPGQRAADRRRYCLPSASRCLQQRRKNGLPSHGRSASVCAGTTVFRRLLNPGWLEVRHRRQSFAL